MVRTILVVFAYVDCQLKKIPNSEQVKASSPDLVGPDVSQELALCLPPPQD